MALGQGRLSGRRPVPLRDCPFAGGMRGFSLPPGPFPPFLVAISYPGESMRLVPRLLIPLAMGLLALSAGCASHSGFGSSGYPEESWYAQRQRAAQEARFRRSYEAVFDESAEEGGPRQAKAVQVARSAIGTPYVPGGRNPGGFDCSGLVQWAYKSVGINLPRTAREQSAVGKRITRVEDMRAGDIVAFHHPRRGYHTGIYVGDGKFVHSPRRRTRVRINSLDDPYFRTTFMGAVREISHSRSKSKAGVSQKSSRDKKSSVKKNNSRNKSKSSVSRKDSSKKSSVKKSSRSKSKSSVQKKSSGKKSSGKQGRNTKK